MSSRYNFDEEEDDEEKSCDNKKYIKIKNYRDISGNSIILKQRTDTTFVDNNHKKNNKIVQFELINNRKFHNFYIDLIILIGIFFIFQLTDYYLATYIITIFYFFIKLHSLLSSVDRGN